MSIKPGQAPKPFLCGETFQIRLIQPANLEAVLWVYQQCEDFLALGPDPHASLAMISKDMQISGEQGGVYCGIYDLTGRITGILDFIPCMYQNDPCQAYISLLMIAQPYRNTGLGRAIVHALEEHLAQSQGVTRMFASVQVNNPSAIRFWQRNGYRIIAGPELQPDQTTVFHLQKDL